MDGGELPEWHCVDFSYKLARLTFTEYIELVYNTQMMLAGFLKYDEWSCFSEYYEDNRILKFYFRDIDTAVMFKLVHS